MAKRNVILCVAFLLFGTLSFGNPLGHSVKSDVTSLVSSKENRTISPYTGYTRETWIEVTEKILAGVFQYVDPESGMFHLPESTGAYHTLEDYHKENQARIAERIYVGVLYYYLATGRESLPKSVLKSLPAEAQKRQAKLSMTDCFVKCFTQGTDPQSKFYWGEPEKADQLGATIAQAIYSAPEKFWNPLSQREKDNVVRFLEKQSVNYTWPNNHHYFHLFTTKAIETGGGEGNRDLHTKRLNKLLGWYRGEGLFIDGNNRGFDYYNFWGFQLFNQMILAYDPLWSESYGERIRKTSQKFMETVPYLYSREDGHIPWGRSLTYRFAASCAIGWNVVNNTSSMSPGLARRLLSGDLKYFVENGCTGENGLLNIGYRGENQDIAERYIVPGDPYFALHGLVPIILPKEHPFWSATEEPGPADGEGGAVVLKGAGAVAKTYKESGDARIFFAGQTFHRDYWQCPIKYMQHSYSAQIGFPVVGDDGEDIGVGRTGYSYDGKNWLYRWRSNTLLLSEDHIASEYPLQAPDYKTSTVHDFERDHLITHTLIGESGEVHIFWHNYPTPIYLSVGGYGICQEHGTASCAQEVSGGSCGAKEAKGLKITTQGFESLLLQCFGAKGTVSQVTLQPREGWANTHLFGGIGTYPEWVSDAPVGPHKPVVVFVSAGKGDSSLPLRSAQCPHQNDENRATSHLNGAIPVITETTTGLKVLWEGKEFEIDIIDLYE